MSKELEALNKLRNVSYDDYHSCMLEDTHRDSLNIIEEALKRNEPMKVDLETIVSISFGDFYNCPKCGEAVIGTYYNYCFYCGQKIDWGEGK